MKIVIITLGMYPDSKDGSAKYIRGVYDELLKRGFDVAVLTAQWGEGFTDPHIISIAVPQSRLFWVPKFYQKIRQYLKIHPYDLILTNGSRGSLPLLFSKYQFLTIIHDLGPFETKFTKIPILRWIERWNAKKAVRIITNSEFTKAGIIKRMRTPPEKIHVVYCGYDQNLHFMKAAGEELRAQLGISSPIIYYVGRIDFYKGVDQIIKAYHQAKHDIPSLNLVIGGKATLKMRNIVETWKQDNPDVRFVGIIPDEEMARYYSMADVFCTYSFASEGFGITPIEALACGLPVICSDLPAYREILQEHAQFIPPNNPDLLTNAFIEFFLHPKQVDHILTTTQSFINRYTWSTVVDRIVEVFSDYKSEYQ